MPVKLWVGAAMLAMYAWSLLIALGRADGYQSPPTKPLDRIVGLVVTSAMATGVVYLMGH